MSLDVGISHGNTTGEKCSASGISRRKYNKLMSLDIRPYHVVAHQLEYSLMSGISRGRHNKLETILEKTHQEILDR